MKILSHHHVSKKLRMLQLVIRPSVKESAKESLLVFSLVSRMAFLHSVYSLRITSWENNRSNTEHTVVLVIRPLFFHGFGGTSVFVTRS